MANKSRALVESHIKHPEIFSDVNDRVAIYDSKSCSFIFLTESGDQYVRHAFRAMTSAASRFQATFSENKRLPCCDLPDSLHYIRMKFDTLEEVLLAALEIFDNKYDATNHWPDISYNFETGGTLS